MLKVGIVGTGNIFRAAHLPGWLSHPETEIVAFCDVNRNCGFSTKYCVGIINLIMVNAKIVIKSP
jgi:hypothetical protein